MRQRRGAEGILGRVDGNFKLEMRDYRLAEPHMMPRLGLFRQCRGTALRVDRVTFISNHTPPVDDLHAIQVRLYIAIMTADALIYHPTVSHYLRFVATTGMFLVPAPLYFSDTPGLTSSSLQSVATSSSALFSTSPVSTRGTCSAPTAHLALSPPSKLSRSNSPLPVKPSASARMWSTSKLPPPPWTIPNPRTNS